MPMFCGLCRSPLRPRIGNQQIFFDNCKEVDSKTPARSGNGTLPADSNHFRTEGPLILDRQANQPAKKTGS